MSQLYTTEQMRQILDYGINRGLIGSYDKSDILKFISLVEMRELRLLPPRDEKGHFIKVVSNEDISKTVKGLTPIKQ